MVQQVQLRVHLLQTEVAVVVVLLHQVKAQSLTGGSGGGGAGGVQGLAR